MKNILFVTYDGLTDPLGRSQILPYIIGLTEKGYQFTIISCEKPDKFELNHKKVANVLASYPIRWIPLQYHKNPPVFSSVYDLIRMKRKIRKLNNSCSFDMVHTRAGTPALLGLWLKKKIWNTFFK